MTHLTLYFIAVLNIAVMAVGFLYCQSIKRADLVDILWAACIVFSCGFLLLFNEAPSVLRITSCTLAGLWYSRLAFHLIVRYRSTPEEDSRYRAMRAALAAKGEAYEWAGFGAFFLAQAGFAVLFIVPVFYLSQLHEYAWLHIILACALVLVAVCGQHIADTQLLRFKAQRTHPQAVCDSGLWRYSRHPNYFFEWLHWFSYPILGLAAQAYWLWVFPLIMLLFLLYFTGIPHNEKQALASKGEHYKDYQDKTSKFILWKPKA